MLLINSKLEEGQFEIKLVYDEGKTRIDYAYDDTRTVGSLVKGGKPFIM